VSTQRGTRFGLIARRLFEAAFVAIFLLQIYVNVMLHRQVKALEGALRMARQSAASETFRVGDSVPSLPVRTLDGRDIVLNPAAARMNTMILVIDPECEACREAVDDIRKGAITGRGMIILSTVEKGTKELAGPAAVANYTYVLLPNIPVSLRIKLSHPPTVLLLNPRGRVTRVCDRPANCVEKNLSNEGRLPAPR
jgi:hypothetical protein